MEVKIIPIDVKIIDSSFLRNLRMMQINNAGSNAYSYKPLAEASDEDLLYASNVIYSISAISLYLLLDFLQFTQVNFGNFCAEKLSPQIRLV